MNKAYPVALVRKQTLDILLAWGMSEAHAVTTADLMTETDLRGVDSHGISMLPTYDKEFRAGRLNMRPVFKTYAVVSHVPVCVVTPEAYFRTSKLTSPERSLPLWQDWQWVSRKGRTVLANVGAGGAAGGGVCAIRQPTNRGKTTGWDLIG